MPLVQNQVSVPTGYQDIDGVYVAQDQQYNTWFEEQYSTTAEPWSYSRRGGELYRHVHTLKLLRRHCPYPASLLELGCSRGLMTARLIPFAKALYATDVSLSAVRACKQRCDEPATQHGCAMHYYVTTTPGLPFADNSFEVVTLCDGMIGWWFSEDQKQTALRDTYRVLRPGGYAVFTDYITPDQFPAYIDLVEQSEFSVVSTNYLYDRPWYLLEALVKKLPGKAALEPVVSSVQVAALLHRAGSLVGPAAARHIIIIARKG